MKSLNFIFLLLLGFSGTWVQAQNTACAGTWTEAAEGTFVDGFTYGFTTNGNEVTVAVELLDPKDGLVAYAQTYNPNFAETQMDPTGGQAFSKSFPGQTAGEPFTVAIKFAFAGGLATSTQLIYTVGETCGGAVALNLPINFENDAIDYELQDFGGNASEIVVDPTDPENMVVQSIKTTAAEVWAGTTVGEITGFATAISFAPGSTRLSVRVWSPTAGTPVRLKVEEVGVPSISVETQVNTTLAGEWETMEFDFANEVEGTAAINFDNTYNKASIFFNFGTSGADAGEQTYYWDDLELVVADGLNFPVTFENAGVDYGLVDFGDNISAIVVDPTDPGNMVVETTKPLSAPLWAGTTVGEGVGFVNPFPFEPGATTITVRVWSPTAGTTLRLKAEHITDPTISVETEAVTTVAEEWETLSFDFSNEAPGTAAINFTSVYRKVSIFFNFGISGGDAGQAYTFYWDDMAFLPGPPPADPVNLPVTFEDDDLDYGLTDFGGNASEMVVDPTDPGNMVAQSLKTDGAEVWAGTTIAGGVGFESAIPFAPGSTSMTVRVWSPNADTPVRLKVEDVNNGAIASEAQVNTTVASQWETLTFDFSTPIEGPALNLGNTYNLASIFFNFGTVGTGITYYWDDVEFLPGEPAEGFDLPVTFEDEEIDYMLTDFEGAVSEIIADPTNPSNTVAQTIKTNSAAPWAGTTIGGDNGFVNTIPFTADATTMSVKVWSPTSGTPVRLKVEQSFVPTVSVETEAVTTVAGAWETLVFDFANEATGTAELNLASSYNKATIFFNFGTEGSVAGEQTYYWDDVEFGTGSAVTTTVFGIIANSASHTMLEAAIILAGLDGTLSGDGPFTVFAPTDAAMALVPPAFLAALMADPTGDLTEVLLYHVLGSEEMTGDLSDGQTTETLQGENISVTISGGVISINDAILTSGDLQADNGVVHVINAVLLPSTVGVEYLNAADHNINVGPNPAVDYVNIAFGEDLTGATFLTVYDISGKLVKQQQIQNQFTQLSTSDLRSGTYVLRIQQGDNHYFQKLMIAK